MKKIICVILALVMALCTLTACGKKEETTDLAAAASELKADCEELTTYIDAGLEQGYLADEDKDLFNSYVTRLDEIINGEGEPASAEELESLRSDLAVLASKCAAPNDIVDLFVGGDKIEEETEAADNADETAASGEEKAAAQDEPEKSADEAKQESNENNTPAPKLSNDFNTLISDYLDLQNEASQKVDKGEVEMDDYTKLLEAGTNLASLKEEAEANGETDDINKRADELKATIYDIAEKMNSDLADKFR